MAGMHKSITALLYPAIFQIIVMYEFAKVILRFQMYSNILWLLSETRQDIILSF